MNDLIQSFTQAYGPSGHEDQVREVIRRAVAGYCDRTDVDALGNLICYRQGSGDAASRKRVMLAGHMDEIGIIVTHIDDKGFVRFANVGGVPPAVLLGQRVVFADGRVGAIGSERIDDLKDLKHEKLFIDIGAASRDQAVAQVQVGDVATYQRPLEQMGALLSAKAMDDRIGCVVVAETLRRLKNSPHDIYAVFTTQEEVGLRGAKTSAYGVDPDFGLAFDVCPVGDTPKAQTILNTALGGGAAIKAKDNSVIVPPKVKDMLVRTAQAAGIKYQLEVLAAGGTDTGAIQLTKAGVPAGCISIPTRYIHTPVETVMLSDVEACVQLSVRVLSGPIEV